MSVQFCMLNAMNGSEIAVAVDAVIAVGSEDGQTIVVHQGGQIAVKGAVREVILRIIGASTIKFDGGQAKKAA